MNEKCCISCNFCEASEVLSERLCGTDRNRLLGLKWRISQRTYDMFQGICQQGCKAQAHRVPSLTLVGGDTGTASEVRSAMLFYPRRAVSHVWQNS